MVAVESKAIPRHSSTRHRANWWAAVKLGCKTIENIKDGDGTFSMIGELFGLEEAGEVLDRLLSGRLEENPFEKDLESIMGSWDRLVGMNKH